MMSEISKLRAISSKLEEVAFAICSSRAELDANQPAMMIESLISGPDCFRFEC